MQLTFSQAALDDLIDIALFIAQDNPDRALSYVDEIEAHCRRLLVMPAIGTLRPDLAAALRMLPHDRYLIFYKHSSDNVRIARVLHSSRDVNGDDLAD